MMPKQGSIVSNADLVMCFYTARGSSLGQKPLRLVVKVQSQILYIKVVIETLVLQQIKERSIFYDTFSNLNLISIKRKQEQWIKEEKKHTYLKGTFKLIVMKKGYL